MKNGKWKLRRPSTNKFKSRPSDNKSQRMSPSKEISRPLTWVKRGAAMTSWKKQSRSQIKTTCPFHHHLNWKIAKSRASPDRQLWSSETSHLANKLSRSMRILALRSQIQELMTRKNLKCCTKTLQLSWFDKNKRGQNGWQFQTLCSRSTMSIYKASNALVWQRLLQSTRQKKNAWWTSPDVRQFPIQHSSSIWLVTESRSRKSLLSLMSIMPLLCRSCSQNLSNFVTLKDSLWLTRRRQMCSPCN